MRFITATAILLEMTLDADFEKAVKGGAESGAATHGRNRAATDRCGRQA
jgi:hypothetical protein